MNQNGLTVARAPAALVTGDYFNREQLDLIKRQIAPGASDDELKLFAYQCQRTGLDPFSRQIYALKRREYDSERGQWVEKMTHQTAIDGLRIIAERTGCYCPGDDPTFEFDGGKLVKATAYVKKRTNDGTWHVVSASAFYDEYVALKKDGKPNRMWAEKPRLMLAKCAEALALRKAFPAEMSGVYTNDEMSRHDETAAPVTYTPPAAPQAEAPPPQEVSGQPVHKPGKWAPPGDEGEAATDEQHEDLKKALMGKPPEGLGWSKTGAVGWVKKLFGVPPADLTRRMAEVATGLLIHRMVGEEGYRTALAQAVAAGEVMSGAADE